jgi:predicted DNA-binding transcriptional regulator AlpA
MTAVHTIRVVLPARERTISVAAPSDAWMTQEQVARHIGVNRATVSQWTNRDDDPLPCHCPSPQAVRYWRAEVNSWLLRQPGRSVAA